MKTIVCSAALLAATSGASLAADFDAQRTGFTGVGGITVTTNLGTAGYSGGLIEFTYGVGGSPAGMAAGQFVGPQGSTFNTFCIELDQGASQLMKSYDIVDLASAPNPAAGGANPNNPNAYGPTIATAIKKVVAAAIGLGWLNGDLSAASATTAQLAAIQGEIWRAVYGNASYSNGGVNTAATTLANTVTAGTYGSSVKGLRAMVSGSSQDQLYVVPLPPAAFAGLATLAGIAGVSRLRRR